MSTRVVVCCGSGGVGKTTASAALGLSWALAGARVAVLTIDPARRLADSLDIGEIGNEPRRVPLERIDPHATGSLDALMLDAKASWDDLVNRFSESPEAAARLLENHYYGLVSTRLGGSHEFMAQEKLLQLWQSGDYDIVVLDTPPTRHALDFLKAPDRLGTLMDDGVMRWLVMPATRGGWRALELASEAMARVLRRLVGENTVKEIAEFFEAMRGMWSGFRERSLQVKTLLRDPGTRFLLVTTPAPAARGEALYFLEVLREREMPFGGFVVNRVVHAPEQTVDWTTLPPEGPVPPDRWRALLRGLAHAPEVRRQMSDAHRHSIASLLSAGPRRARHWEIPDQDDDLHSLEGLARLAPHLPKLDWVQG